MYHVGMHMSGGSWDLRCNACVVRSTRTECDMGGPRPSRRAHRDRPHEGPTPPQTTRVK